MSLIKCDLGILFDEMSTSNYLQIAIFRQKVSMSNVVHVTYTYMEISRYYFLILISCSY